MAAGRFKRLAFRMATVVVLSGLSLVLIEVTLGVTKLNSKATIRFIPNKGITRVPNSHYRHTKEGFSEGRFNSHGFRDVERTYEKPDGVYRIAIFGDSYVEALQVEPHRAFPAVLERRLNEVFDDPRFEVLAFGQSGFGTTDSLMRYLNFGVEYSPDLIMLAFLTGNDFRNNHRHLNYDLNGFYYRLDDNEELVLDTSLIDAYGESLTPVRRLFIGLKQRSYLVSLLAEQWYHQRLRWRRQRMRSTTSASQETPLTPAIDEFSDMNIYRAKPPAAWQEAYAITNLVLRRFNDVVREKGSQFMLLTLTNSEQLDVGFAERLREMHGPAFDLDRPDRFIRDVAEDAGIPCLTLLPAFREHQSRSDTHLHGFGGWSGGHWNESGHRLAAELIMDFLIESWNSTEGAVLSRPLLMAQEPATIPQGASDGG